MRIQITFIAILSLFYSCNRVKTTEDMDVLVKVKNKTLMRSELTGLIPQGVSSADSLLLAESYINRWIKDALVYDVAFQNLGKERDSIEQQVEEYRQSLVRYKYQAKLLKEKLSASIRESDKVNYYEENPKRFILDRGLVKGLFLKIPIDAPGLSDIKVWYKSRNEAALEKIEKYSLQNAVIYEYFYDRWVDVGEVMNNIPIRIANPNNYISANKAIEISDSTYCYLLNVKEYLPSGSVAPYDYAEPQILELLINQRKVDFFKKFEDDLYNEATKNGDVKYFTE